ncbi:DUF4124 domain-containing protein [Candidatus Nitrotoga sp. M5]|uniref:DUF4124 domain-containing protein n=1 Tax=Candidatus Nitrotoga sp. M5 TaxID=2890409 RepID=UPI001EF21080|nr:DUF4124 domain-containing protein [Candidatus Nitrotoga sp. M5]CAH1385671.1 conserved exported hypothetical protein [Candidatus Nitrotoga sp. M5]
MKIFRASLLLIVVAFSTTAEARLYKWVDDKGVTHYGEVMPPEYTNRNNILLDDHGRLIKRNEKVNNTDQRNNDEAEAEAEAKKRIDNEAKLERNRKDRALLNTFSNEKEIDLARDRNLNHIESLISSIQSLQKVAQENLKNYQQEAEERKLAGRELSSSLQVDITESEDKLAKLQLNLVKTQEKAAAIKASYEADKVRFRELKGSVKNKQGTP